MGSRIWIAGWHLAEISGTATVLREMVKRLERWAPWESVVVVPKGTDVETSARVVETGTREGHAAWLEDFVSCIEDPDDLVLFPSVHLPKRSPGRFVSILHDMIPWEEPGIRFHPIRRSRFLREHRRHGAALSVVTVSNDSKRKILEVLGWREDFVRVVPNAVDSSFGIEGPRGHASLSADYCLYVGDLRRRKNVEIAARAYERLPKDLQSRFTFAFTGEGPRKERILRRARRVGLGERIVSLGKVPAETLPSLYRGASCFVFPSLSEGFGLPILEAQSSGVPVLCGDRSCFPEVAGRGAMYADVTSVADLAMKWESLLRDDSLRVDLASAAKENAGRFSWDRSMDEWKSLLESLASSC